MIPVIGQQRVRDMLSRAIRTETVSHAYIFEGPSGIGKKTVAAQFAAAIHCEQKTGTPCGVCHACRMHEAGTHPDYKIIERELKKASIAVDQIRDMIEDVYLRPMIAEKKVYLFPEADTLNPNAQNALLKVFEEPPGDSVIILSSENSERLLPTIRSRGVRVRFSRHPEEEIRAFVKERYPARSGDAAFISRFADGRLGEAQKLCEDAAFSEKRREFFGAIFEMGEKESAVFRVKAILEANKDERERYLTLLLSYLRDAERLKMQLGNLLNEDYKEELRAFAAHTTAKGLSRAADTVMQTAREMTKYSNDNAWLLTMLLDIWRELHGTGNWRPVS